MAAFKSIVSFCKDCIYLFKEKPTQKTSQQSDFKSASDLNTSSNKDNKIFITITKSRYEFSHGKKFKNTPKWIVVHYTACPGVSARGMCKAMSKNEGASSHFYVDEKSIFSSVPLDYIAWHVASGQCAQPIKGKTLSLEELSNYKSKTWRYDLAAKSHLQWKAEGEDFTGNSVSIGVDLCVKKKNLSTKKATDNDWYFEDEAVENAAKLIAYLSKEYNIDESHIITHCMATGKLCPTVWVSKTDGDGLDELWFDFKKRIAKYKESESIVKYVED